MKTSFVSNKLHILARAFGTNSVTVAVLIIVIMIELLVIVLTLAVKVKSVRWPIRDTRYFSFDLLSMKVNK